MVLILEGPNRYRDRRGYRYKHSYRYTPLHSDDSFRLLEILPPKPVRAGPGPGPGPGLPTPSITSSYHDFTRTNTTAAGTAAGTTNAAATFDDSLIECRLHHVADISHAKGTYDALSYTWGHPGRGMVAISLNGQEFHIQRNLWLFLRQLRRYYYYHHHHPHHKGQSHGHGHGHVQTGRSEGGVASLLRGRYVWVDAISINQNDLVERGQQVQVMNRIFPSAANVLVWLGEEADRSAQAFSFLRYFHQKTVQPPLPRSRSCSRSSQDQDGNENQNQNDDDALLRTYKSLFGGSDDQTHIWLALQRLCEREYWTRLWIIQEVLLARDLVLFCGDHSLPWDAFKYACAGPATVKGFFPPPDVGNSNSNGIGNDNRRSDSSVHIHNAKMAMSRTQFRELSHQRALQQQRNRYLCQLIEAYGVSAQCTDVRDRIYGLLGLSRDWSPEFGIDIDYSRSELALLVNTLCSSHIPDDPSGFGLLLIHVLRLDRLCSSSSSSLSSSSSSTTTTTTTPPPPTSTSHGSTDVGFGFSTVFAQALRDKGVAAELVDSAPPIVGSNVPWIELPTSSSATSTASATSQSHSLTSNTIALARHTYHSIDIALRRQVTTIYASGLGTFRFTTATATATETAQVPHPPFSAYTHVAIRPGDLVFTMPDTAIGLIYRASSRKTLQYIGWAIPEVALNQLDPFWVTDAGIDASLRFLTPGTGPEPGSFGSGSGSGSAAAGGGSGNSSLRNDLVVNAISANVLHLRVQLSVWDLLFLLACSPNGYYHHYDYGRKQSQPQHLLQSQQQPHQQQRQTRPEPVFWWGKPLPLIPTDNCYEIRFGQPDARFEKRSRTWRH